MRRRNKTKRKVDSTILEYHMVQFCHLNNSLLFGDLKKKRVVNGANYSKTR